MAKNIYIGKSVTGDVLGVILADNIDLADVYFQTEYEGDYNKAEYIDLNSDLIKDRKFIKLVSTTKLRATSYDSNSSTPKDYRIVNKRGG